MEEKSDKTGKYLFQKGNDSRRNLEGRPKGTLGFKTIFEQAVKKIAKEKDLKECDIEIDLVIKAISAARTGSYHYYKDVFDRLYGKAKESIEHSGSVDSEVKVNEETQKVFKEFLSYRKTKI